MDRFNVVEKTYGLNFVKICIKLLLHWRPVYSNSYRLLVCSTSRVGDVVEHHRHYHSRPLVERQILTFLYRTYI